MASNGQCQTRNRPKDTCVIYQICRHGETVCPTVQVPLTPVDPAAMAGHTLATHIAGYGSMVYPPIHATAIFTKAIDIAAARRPEFQVLLPSLRVAEPKVIEYLTGNGVDLRCI
jgi:hypothetical protein